MSKNSSSCGCAAAQLTSLTSSIVLPIWSLLSSGCSILNRYLMPGGSVLLPYVWQRIFPAVIEQCRSMGEPELVGIFGQIPKCSWSTSLCFGAIVFSFLQVGLDRMICASICWAVFHVRQTASALQLDILITRIPLAWSWWLEWGGIWTC